MQNSELRYRRLFEAARDGILVHLTKPTNPDDLERLMAEFATAPE